DECACGTANVADRNEYSAIAGDTLSPVTQRFIQHDLWSLWVPGEAIRDRGRVLEQQWRTLDRLNDRNYAGDSVDGQVYDFAELARATRPGRPPSIIFSPTLLDPGEPLLISDLTLSAPAAGNKIGVEFFEQFPTARKGFRVSTATRLNATFPYVSPAAV